MVADVVPGGDARWDVLPVIVCAGDPLSRAGVTSQLRGGHEFSIVGEADAGDLGDHAVALVVADEVDDATLSTVRALRARHVERILVLAGRIDDAGLLAAIEAGVTGVIRRSQATQRNLAAAVRAAATGDGTLPPDLLGRLLQQVGQLQRQVLHPRGLTFGSLSEREVAVLRLLADGLDTSEVARTLFFSERTVKNIIHDITSRLALRNRTHAVAYALKERLI